MGRVGKQVRTNLWKLRIPNKIKVFGWRACQEIFPTHVNLAKRRVIIDNVCQCCNIFPEFRVHDLWDSGVAQDVWAGSSIRLQKRSHGQADMFQLFEYLLDRLSIAKLELFLVQAWIIWNQRNIVIHGGKLKEPSCERVNVTFDSILCFSFFFFN